MGGGFSVTRVGVTRVGVTRVGRFGVMHMRAGGLGLSLKVNRSCKSGGRRFASAS
jgi:hypothetical protein